MRAISILRRSLSASLTSVHRARLAAVYRVVEALLAGGVLASSALGRSIGGRVDDKHSIKRVDRLLGNEHLHAEATLFFWAIAALVLRGIERPILLVDWTEVGDDHVALAAATPVGGRGVPVYFEVHPLKSLSNSKVERQFLLNLRDHVLPEGCRPIIVTDAGFKNPWFRTVLSLGWDFVGRLSAGVLVIDADADKETKADRDNWVRAKTLHAQASTRPKDLGRKTVAKSNPLDVRLVIVKQRSKGRKGSRKVTRKGVHPGATAYKKYQRRANEPWLLATSLKEVSARRVVGCYRLRMRIEETFRDAKNHRYGWSFEDARSRSTDRLQVLLLLGSLGMLALTLIGLAGEWLGVQYGYQANTVRTRRVLSLFVLGKRMEQRGELVGRPWSLFRSALGRLRETIRESSAQVLAAET